MCACIRVFSLLFQNNLCTSACSYVMFTRTCLLRAYDIHIDVCYLLYDIICLLYIFYIELELSLSGELKSITVVKAPRIFMYAYTKLAPP